MTNTDLLDVHLSATDRAFLVLALDSYLATARWLAVGDDYTEVPKGADWSREAREEAASNVTDFYASVREAGLDLGTMTPETFGHDFYLTRNRHGAGFWDRGLGDLGTALTDLAHPWGEASVYVGDDGLLYLS
jgi:hypothetical protein